MRRAEFCYDRASREKPECCADQQISRTASYPTAINCQFLSNDQEVIKVPLVDVDLLSIVDMIAMQYITSPHVE